MLHYLHQNRAETLKLLKPKIKNISHERGVRGGGAQPPRGVVHPPLSKLRGILLRNGRFRL